MTNSPKNTTFDSLAKLPRTPASDVKRLGWRGMMSALRTQGALLVTNHDEPEAVIVPAAEYDALMQLVAQMDAQTQSALEELRKGFDERLAILNDRAAAARLHSTIQVRAALHGKVKAVFGS